MCDNIITWFAFNFGTIIKGFYTFSRCFYFDFYVKHLTKFDNSLSNKKLWKLNSPKASYSSRDIFGVTNICQKDITALIFSFLILN